ncbi:MAG: fumarylacetoacetate hydrolase family protein [Acidihalobacter sp.]|uniref:fumarylacetoacetate hydrolase family protein n=1 Tax=Acidihalobacter sp. TaxID=1872108 RepID=UPI00307DF5CC
MSNALELDPQRVLPADADAVLLGRVWLPECAGPAVVAVRGGELFDVTTSMAPTVRDVLESPDPKGLLDDTRGRSIGGIAEVLANSDEKARDPQRPWLLSPVDLQAVKAAGVTFAASMLERVIEEQAKGEPQRAADLRREIVGMIGTELVELVPGSPAAMSLKQTLIKRGLWSQYLEVGIGPDAEIFTKAQPLSSVGIGAHVGIHPASRWNNPEPEVAVLLASDGRMVGATLANDVNLRDFEGRSALLLGKAKDNNASCAIGPFIRLFDQRWGVEDLQHVEVSVRVDGSDGFRLDGTSSMAQISRSPAALAQATLNENHQYPDGVVLLLGTLFAPVQDRGEAGSGFTHHADDVVGISAPELGCLSNRVRTSDRCAPWTFGAGALMRNLAARGVL